MIVGPAGTLGHLVGCLGRYVFATGVRSEAGKLRATWNGGLRLVGCVRVTNGGFRRVSPVALRPHEGPLTEPIADAQPRPQERVLMPQKRPWPGPRESIGQPGKQSFDRAANSLSHRVTTAKTRPPHRAVVHDPDADTYDAASAIVAP